MTRELPLTVLAWEGPQARAYLVRMRRAGLRPRRIVLLVRDRFGARGPVAENPAVLRVGARFQDRSHNHHPYRIRRDRPALIGAIATAMTHVVPGTPEIIGEMFDGFDYDRYSDRVETIGMSGYGDPAVLATLAASAGETVVFTGGGILPGPVFETGATLVHVHTGLLPHVRGADVLLWSMLVRGRPGVSAFVMTPGLDDGDVLATREVSELRIDVPGGDRPDDDLLYRAVFSFVDPLLRAELLVTDVLEPWDATAPLRGEPQDLGTGVTYHFMHPIVRARALGRLFVSAARAEPEGHGDVPDPARYDRYYDRPSVVAPLRFAYDASRAKAPLRALGLRNRQRDYAGLADRPDRRVAHRAMNEQLSAQAREWPTYDYGEGYHYQSSDELGVTGLRDTTGRVEAFGLRDLVAGRDVLEIGCNAGFLSLAIAPAARRVVAFELNPYLIEIARIGARTLGVDNVEFLVSSFEGFDTDERFDDVLSFANHHTYDGNTHQSLDEYFARCRDLLRPGGRLIFESHPPALEGAAFGGTVEIIERHFDLERSEIHRYGTFLDQDRRFLVGTRRED